MISLLASSSEDLIGELVWLVVSGVVGVLRTLIFSSLLLLFLPCLCFQESRWSGPQMPSVPLHLSCWQPVDIFKVWFLVPSVYY